MSQAQDLYRHAKMRIPGGVQLLSKRPEQYAPEQWPSYFIRAKGCEVWDVDHLHYYDMTTNGIGACLLGYADPDVSSAVIKRVEEGSMSTLNPPEEVELADRLCEIHPWAEQVRFARTGGEICAIAIRIARATTGRDVVAVCGYHVFPAHTGRKAQDRLLHWLRLKKWKKQRFGNMLNGLGKPF